MKFAFVSTMQGWAWGGSEELWSQAAARLKQEGHEVQASVGYWPRLSDKVIALAKRGIKVETHYSYQYARARRLWNKLSQGTQRGYARLRRFNPDLVVISQGHNSGGFQWAKACRQAGLPYVIVVQCNGEFWWFKEDVVSDAVASYTGARKVFCVSRSNLELLRLQAGDLLPNGEVIFNPYNVSVDAAPSWPKANGKVRLACVARMDIAAKGQDLLLQLLSRPEWRKRSLELSFYGAGPDEVALRRLANLLNVANVQFKGHVHDIRSIWEDSHVLVLPSRYEGLPLALVEAMWCARPAVVTDVGGNAELCVDNQTGFVSPAATTTAFAATMERAWDRRGEWPDMGRAARTRVEEQVPRDPIGNFCERLKVCANAAAEKGVVLSRS